MSYQPQTEAATSRFLNVEEAGKTLRIHFNDIVRVGAKAIRSLIVVHDRILMHES
ncbi:2-hydroxy-6-ketonona-2%2C4-dienedioic acid hydrolase [Shigella sonnei]|nr:2-hydroxy-6-ketonona-2%2C4-dienedioic acid hydrolase [Shigella sonnei]